MIILELFAHRGYSAKYPENTMVAFRAAMDYEVDGIELDVHMTKDGHIVVIHDEKVDRTTNGKGYVKDMTIEEIKALNAGSKFNPLFEGEKIPLLEEVMQLLEPTNLKLNIELKSDVFSYYGMDMKVLKLVEKYNMQQRTIISSFDHETLTRIAEVTPHIETAPLFSNIIVEPWIYAKSIGANAMHISGYFMMRQAAINALKQGANVRVYTINEEEHMNLLWEAQVAGFFTDEVEKAIEWRKKKK